MLFESFIQKRRQRQKKKKKKQMKTEKKTTFSEADNMFANSNTGPDTRQRGRKMSTKLRCKLLYYSS